METGVVVKPKLADEIRAQIAAVATTATAEDRKRVSEVISLAKGAEFGSVIYEFTPGVAALLFLEDNPHNRDWDVKWTVELARRIRAGLWSRNNQSIGFYVSGLLADGQHRLAAVAITGITWRTIAVFGLETSAISTVDAGKRRHASDAAKLEGIGNTRIKESILRASASYMVRLGNKNAALPSETELAQSIRTNNERLDTAIDIATSAERNVVTPVLKTTPAATVAYLMLAGGWPEQRVREKLALFNTGQSVDGENDPFFTAADIITKARAKADAKDRLSGVKEVGLVIAVMNLTAQGLKAVQGKALKKQIEKQLPDPTYVSSYETMQQAA